MEQSKPRQPEPHVTLFGEPVNDSESTKKSLGTAYRIESEGNVLIGLVLSCVGLILLGNTLGIISWQFWEVVTPFWPVLLILAGISTLLGAGFGSNLLMFVITVFTLSVLTTAGLDRIESPLMQYLPQGLIDISRSLTNLSQHI